VSRFTAAEKAKEIEIEAAVRIRIYSRDAAGRRDKLSPAQLRKIELLEEIVREYRAMADHERSPIVTVTLVRDGKPLTAGEIPEGAEVIFDRTTGEVTAIRPPKTS
jgi:hypothetical protein